MCSRCKFGNCFFLSILHFTRIGQYHSTLIYLTQRCEARTRQLWARTRHCEIYVRLGIGTVILYICWTRIVSSRGMWGNRHYDIYARPGMAGTRIVSSKGMWGKRHCDIYARPGMAVTYRMYICEAINDTVRYMWDGYCVTYVRWTF